MNEYLTTTSAARLAGVGVSSIKRWADEGKLRTVRTPGGHRRLVKSDLVAFLQDAHSSTVKTESDHIGSEWADAILELEFHALQARLLKARGRNGSWIPTMDELSVGIRETGIRWVNNTITIAEEHVASERLARVLSSIYESMPLGPDAPICLLANAEGDMHTLGLSMLQVALRELGWQSLWLGAMTPISEVCMVVETTPIDMVAISASGMSTDSSALSAQIQVLSQACKASETQLILGGRGAWPESLPYGNRLDNFVSLPPLIERRR